MPWRRRTSPRHRFVSVAQRHVVEVEVRGVAGVAVVVVVEPEDDRLAGGELVLKVTFVHAVVPDGQTLSRFASVVPEVLRICAWIWSYVIVSVQWG